MSTLELGLHFNQHSICLRDLSLAIKYIDKTLPKLKPLDLSAKEIDEIEKINTVFTKPYKASIEILAPLINKMAKHIPARRERMLHIGLFGYSRGVGKVSLPRAITFTGALYSLGVPPELIGTGRALRQAQKLGYLKTIKRLYVNLERDLIHAGKSQPRNLQMLNTKEYPEFKNVIMTFRNRSRPRHQTRSFKDHHFIHRTSSLLSSTRCKWALIFSRYY
jgi:phosphoenolpyruvate carboxylase